MKINIRSNKGVTITGLVIYVSSFFMICAVIGVITTFFFNNTKFLSGEATASAEFDILNAYLAKEAKTDGNIVRSIEEPDKGGNWIEFLNGNKYIYESGKIYLLNITTNKYFVVANYIQEVPDGSNYKPIFQENNNTFTLNIRILNKDYIQVYNISN